MDRLLLCGRCKARRVTYGPRTGVFRTVLVTGPAIRNDGNLVSPFLQLECSSQADHT